MVNSIRTSDSHNVVGYVEGSEAPEEFVLIMGHWDHLGVDTNLEGDQIHNGAVDNATGQRQSCTWLNICKKNRKDQLHLLG